MDVHLLVYDLSRGLARQMSMQFLGFQIDAIYHTSIKLNGLEYVYDGNVVSIVPGSSHLGQPEQEIYLGRTELHMDVIEEYLDSLREIYTVDNYDLWRHNCNNFSNDLSTFLVGKGIPEHIVNLPQTVLNSPSGQMLFPMLDQQINANRNGGGGIWGIQGNQPNSSTTNSASSRLPNGVSNGAAKPKARLHHHEIRVQTASNLSELEALLASAQGRCAVVFFTSQTCAPCKAVYPLYDELAAEVGQKGVLIKVDTSAIDAATKYSITATPTFVTFLKGEVENRWSGADPSKIRGNVQLLVQMAWPAHPHDSLNLPTFSNTDAKPLLFTKIPPLHKLLGKLGPDVDNPAVQGVKHFVEARASDGPAEATLPDMAAFSSFVARAVRTLPPEILFAVVDLMRCGLADPRFSGYFAEEKDHQTLLSVLDHVNKLDDCPYALRLVTLQMASNLFSSPLYPDQILGFERLRAAITQLISTSFLDDNHSSVRVATASLLCNVSLANSEKRRNGPGDVLPEDDQVELAASTLEAITQEESSVEALEGMLRGFGWLVYRLPLDGELADLLRTLDAEETILSKGKKFPNLALITEVGKKLLGKGLKG